MTKKDRRRAQLDAVKVLKLTQSGKATLQEAIARAVPMVQSKPTKYTRLRRRRALVEVQKAQKARIYVEEYEKRTRPPKPKPKRMTEQQKTRRRAARMLERAGLPPKLTERQRKAIAEGYSAAEVVRGWAVIGSRTWKSRKTKLERGYKVPAGTDWEQLNRELEYRTADKVARAHGFEKTEKEESTPTPITWKKFTSVPPIAITWEQLKKGYGNRISREEIEDTSTGHKCGYLIYENELYEDDIKLTDIDHAGKFPDLRTARADVLEKTHGNDYIYIETADGVGVVLLALEWFSAMALAPDWETSLLYTENPTALELIPEAIDPLTYEI